MSLQARTLVPILLLCALAQGVWAEKADRSKPMNIESDALRYDDVKQASIFTGRVVMTKGSIIIRGELVEVHQDTDGFQFGTITGSDKVRAFYRQKRDGVDEYIEGEADTIEYDGKSDTVKFKRKAQLRRYRGAALADEISGAVIVYQNLTDVFSVDGSVVQSNANNANPGGRVRAMLTPKQQNAEDSPSRAAPLPLKASIGLQQTEADK